MCNSVLSTNSRLDLRSSLAIRKVVKHCSFMSALLILTSEMGGKNVV